MIRINEVTEGDARVLAREIPDQSVDLIFTDPPYFKEYLPLYDWLFETAPRILKPSGFLLTYVGGYWKDEIMAGARRHLSFFWDYIVYEPGNGPLSWPRKTISRHKSILAYRPISGMGMPRTQVLSVWLGGEQDKRFHVWGQDESQARYFIDCFSGIDDLILDPFAGGGTSAAMAKLLRRNFITFEVDPEATARDRARIEAQEEMEIREGKNKSTATLFDMGAAPADRR